MLTSYSMVFNEIEGFCLPLMEVSSPFSLIPANPGKPSEMQIRINLLIRFDQKQTEMIHFSGILISQLLLRKHSSRLYWLLALVSRISVTITS